MLHSCLNYLPLDSHYKWVSFIGTSSSYWFNSYVLVYLSEHECLDHVCLKVFKNVQSKPYRTVIQ